MFTRGFPLRVDLQAQGRRFHVSLAIHDSGLSTLLWRYIEGMLAGADAFAAGSMCSCGSLFDLLYLNMNLMEVPFYLQGKDVDECIYATHHLFGSMMLGYIITKYSHDFSGAIFKQRNKRAT